MNKILLLVGLLFLFSGCTSFLASENNEFDNSEVFISDDGQNWEKLNPCVGDDYLCQELYGRDRTESYAMSWQRTGAIESSDNFFITRVFIKPTFEEINYKSLGLFENKCNTSEFGDYFNGFNPNDFYLKIDCEYTCKDIYNLYEENILAHNSRIFSLIEKKTGIYRYNVYYADIPESHVGFCFNKKLLQPNEAYMEGEEK